MFRPGSCPFLLLINAATILSAVKIVPLPDEIHRGFLEIIHLVYSERFDAAENEAKKIVKKYPDHPAGYFCLAVVADSWMNHYQSDKREDEFYGHCDMAIEKAEKSFSMRTGDPWGTFFIGSCDGFKGTYEARYERWITAFRYGWKGVSSFYDLKSSGYAIPDIDYGIGSYNYWRSALMKTLWWMPVINDKREEGIEQLRRARETGVYTKTMASAALVDILINERRYLDAHSIAEEELKHYPDATLFLWGKARALLGLEQYDSLVPLLTALIRKVESETPDNHFNSITYRYHLSKVYFSQGKYSLAAAECKRIDRFKLEPSVKRRLDPIMGGVKDLKKKLPPE